MLLGCGDVGDDFDVGGGEVGGVVADAGGHERGEEDWVDEETEDGDEDAAELKSKEY